MVVAPPPPRTPPSPDHALTAASTASTCRPSGPSLTRPALMVATREPSRVLQRDPEFGFGLGLHLVERDAVGEFDQGHAVLAVLVDGEHRQISDHHVDHPLAGERQVALLEKFRAAL